MREVTNLDHFAALPMWVVVRTQKGLVRERACDGTWSQMGTTEPPMWNSNDLPAQVLWSYADEIAPAPTLSKLPTGGVIPSPPYPHTWQQSVGTGVQV